MIVRFVSSCGEVNCGIIIDRHEGGMVCVMWDEFTALLMRLESQGRISDFSRRSLGKHVSWVRVQAEHPYGATMELLPIATPIQWNDSELAVAQAQLTHKETI